MDFMTGNISSPKLRDFDFPIENIDDRRCTTFGIEDRDFSEVKFLSTGSNAIVYTGIQENTFVAVKMLRPNILVKNRKVAIQEMNLECQILCKVDHPNIIRIFGAGEVPRKFLMMEYLSGGTLDSLLKQNQELSNALHTQPGLPWLSSLDIAMELASALQYLHDEVHPSARIIHRDLKPQNIGFNNDRILKLFDFGLAACVKKTRLATDAYAMSGFTGTLAYMAPEVALRGSYNEKVDVYSFAIILWQMLSGEMPYQGMTRDQHLQQVALDGQRPSLSAIIANSPSYSAGMAMALLLGNCWQTDFSQRPDFASILMSLKSLKEDSKCKGAPLLSSPRLLTNSVVSLKKFFRRGSSNSTIRIEPDEEPPSASASVFDKKRRLTLNLKPSNNGIGKMCPTSDML